MNRRIHSVWLERLLLACVVCLPLCITRLPAWAQAATPAARGLHGHVFALDHEGTIGGAIPGATIELKNQAGQLIGSPITTDQRGYYRVDLTPGVYSYKVTAAGFKDEDVQRGISTKLSEGYAVWDFFLTPGKNDDETESQEASQPSGETIPLWLGRLSGTVLEERSDGRLVAVADATISLHNNDSAPADLTVVSRPAVSGSGGTGRYEVVLEAGSWEARVSAAGFDSFVDPDPIQITAGQEARRNFILRSTSTAPSPERQGIEGRVRIEGSDALPDALPSIAIVPIAPLKGSADVPSTSAVIAPDSGGRFRRDVNPGIYRILATLDGYRTAQQGRAVYDGKYSQVDLVLAPNVTPQPITPEPLISPPDTQPGDVALKAKVFVGRTTQDDVTSVAPLAGADVLLRVLGEALATAQRETTDKDGIAVFADLISGREYQAIAYHPDFPVTVPAETHDQFVASSVTENSARIVLSGVEITMPEAPPVTADRPMLHVQVVEHSVRGQTGVVEGAEVAIVGPAGQIMTAGPSNLQGRFSALLPAGAYQIHVEKPGYQHVEVDVQLAQQSTERQVVLPRFGPEVPPTETGAEPATPTEPGEATEPGEPEGPESFAETLLNLQIIERDLRGQIRVIANAEVAVMNAAGQIVAAAPSNPQGGFSAHLSPGAYQIHVEKPGFQYVAVPVQIVQQPVEQQIVLQRIGRDEHPPEVGGEKPPSIEPGEPMSPEEPGRALLNVQVIERDLRGQIRAVANAEVAVMNEVGQFVFAAPSDPQGRFSAQLAPGAYQIHVEKPGFQYVAVRVQLPQPGLQRQIVMMRTADGGIVGPPEDRPPEDRPPEDRPPEDRPPEDRPPEDRPPEDRPPEDRPPETGPPSNEPGPPQPGQPNKAPLRVQVVMGDSDPVPGAVVEIHFGPQGRDRIVTPPRKTQGPQGIALFENLPRAGYWILARSGQATGRAGVPSNWNPAQPIKVRLPRQAPPTPPTSPPPTPPTENATLIVTVQGLDLNAKIGTLHALSGATVVVRGNGKQWSGKTAGNGEWRVTLPPGKYQIEANYPTAQKPAVANVSVGNQGQVRSPAMVIKYRTPE